MNLGRIMVTTVSSLGLVFVACAPPTGGPAVPPTGGSTALTIGGGPSSVDAGANTDSTVTPVTGLGADAGVSGGVSSGVTNSAAQAFFTASVAPILQTNCSVSACHGSPGGTGADPFASATQLSDYYARVTSFPDVVGNFDKATAPILQKILGGHFATYTSAQQAAVSQWLDQEVVTRAAGGAASSGNSTNSLLASWSGCMTAADFQSANVATAFATLQSTAGQCKQCHALGNDNFVANPDSPTTFKAVSTNSAFMQVYFKVDTTNPASPTITTNDALFTSVGLSTPPFVEHPNFTYANSNAMTALATFYKATMAHMTANTCGASQLTK